MNTVANSDTNDPQTRLRWRKSRRSGGGGGNGGGNDCVEIAWLDEHGTRAVRDDKLADASPVFAISPGNWRALRTAALNGLLDIR